MYRIPIFFLLFFIISYSSTCQTIIKNGVVIGKEIQKQEIPSEVTTVFGNPIRCLSKLKMVITSIIEETPEVDLLQFVSTTI